MLNLLSLSRRGPVAQLAARLDGIEEVGGSNPPGSISFHCFLAGPVSPIPFIDPLR
jgi:hypothetical protein